MAAAQGSLFGESHMPAPGASGSVDAAGAEVPAAGDGASWAGFASVIVDIPSRALSEPFAYAIPVKLAERVAIGSAVLVPFGRRVEVGYVVARSMDVSCLPGAADLAVGRVKPICQVVAEPAFSARAAELAHWMSREYVASLAECIRLFLPPGGGPKVVRLDDGTYEVAYPKVAPASLRWVSLTPEGRAYEPPTRAVRQRQLIEALSCGPVTTRELNMLYTDMSATVRALEKKGVVAVEERRAWRGCGEATSLSSATASAPAHLTDGQRAALAAIERASAHGAGDVVLVDGVTGSGKTEVYLAAIERVVDMGRSAVVLVPEISLTAQTVGRFRSRFGDAVAVFHSRLTPGERLDQWDMVRTGAARVVVGARSALFCPLADLGLIVIDEEHEQSYKQASSPRYHAREVAAAMARMAGCPLVLGSATPSAEALERCRMGVVAGQRWERIEMPERPGNARLPRIVVADLRREFAAGGRSIFSQPLHDGLLRVAERHEKAVLLHNRRGFASFLMCRECGCVPTCNHCSTALTYHERTHTLQCHTCGSVWRVRPYPETGSACPKCGSRYLAKMGLGTQQVEDAVRQLMPAHVEVIRMDADSTRGKDAHKRLLEQFDAAECAVLVGTQMIAKGLDFPEVTLVGVINADYALKMPDFRAGERAFDLLEQVAGRAGRGEHPGEVVIQTYLPDEPVIRAVAEHDRAIFTDHDLAQRRDALYPPYVRLVNILVWGPDERAAREHVGRIADGLREQGPGSLAAFRATPAGAALDDAAAGDAPALDAIQVLGPAPCVIERAKDRYRFHVMVKAPLGFAVSALVAEVLGRVGTRPAVSVAVDVDAFDLM